MVILVVFGKQLYHLALKLLGLGTLHVASFHFSPSVSHFKVSLGKSVDLQVLFLCWVFNVSLLTSLKLSELVLRFFCFVCVSSKSPEADQQFAAVSILIWANWNISTVMQTLLCRGIVSEYLV